MISDDNDTQCSSRLAPLDLTFISKCMCLLWKQSGNKGVGVFNFCTIKISPSNLILQVSTSLHTEALIDPLKLHFTCCFELVKY